MIDQVESGGVSQAGAQNGYDVVHECSKLMERINDRLTLKNPRLVQRYRESKLLIGVRLGTGQSGQEFEAWFYRPLVGSCEKESQLSKHFFEFIGGCFCKDLTGIKTTRHGADCQQHAMLSDVVKSVEDPQEVIPSVVRLEPLDRIDRYLPRSLYFSLNFGSVYRGLEDWEVDPAGVRGTVPSVATHQMEGQMIKGASQVLDNIRSDQGNLSGNGLDAFNKVNWSSRILIDLGANSVRARLEKSADPTLQITDVLFGPFHF